MFDVHRLILSAISPHFYEIFSKSHQTCVKLDDISRRSLEYLIAYIYSGKVQVESQYLKDFLKAVKALDVQGIDGIDENSNLNNFKPMPLKSEPNETIGSSFDRDDICEGPNCESTNYDDDNDVNSNNSQNVNARETETVDDSHQNANANWTPDSDESIANGEEDEESYCTCEFPCPDETNVEQSQNVCTFSDSDSEIECVPSKRARIESDEFNIRADIHLSARNKESLIHNGYRFYKVYVSKNVTHWACTRRATKDECRAFARTRLINVVPMMKLVTEHTHIPQAQIDEADFNIKADIRLSQKNKENLLYDGYRFSKHYYALKTGATHWQCTYSSSKKCLARVHTKMINGQIMMKIVQAEHTH